MAFNSLIICDIYNPVALEVGWETDSGKGDHSPELTVFQTAHCIVTYQMYSDPDHPIYMYHTLCSLVRKADYNLKWRNNISIYKAYSILNCSLLKKDKTIPVNIISNLPWQKIYFAL